MRALERTIATDTASPQVLEDMQRLLAAEAAEPSFLRAVRALRVMYYESLEVMRTGRFDWVGYRVRHSMLGQTGDDLIARGQARTCQAAYLRHATALVEIAKLPPEIQEERLEESGHAYAAAPHAHRRADTRHRLGEAGTEVPHGAGRAALRDGGAGGGALSSGGAPLARRPGALVPRYLAAVPIDPFDGKRLRWCRLHDGLVIYSVGPDGSDDGGKLQRKQPAEPGTDVGFRLWDADRRGAPPPE